MSHSHVYGGRPPGMSAKHHFGHGGMGTQGSNIPSSGTDGFSALYDDIILPADAGKEYYWIITSITAGLTLSNVGEDGSFTATATTLGSYRITYDLYQNGAFQASTYVDCVFGPGVWLTSGNCTGGSVSSSSSITITPAAGGTINLAVSSCVQSAISGVSAIHLGLPDIDPALSCTVVFSGGNNTVVFSGGTNRVSF